MYLVDFPIPRPEPSDQLRCDQSKPYASDDVCFPVESISNSAFSIEEIFGRSIRGACPVAQSSDTGHVHVHASPSMKVEPQPDLISDNKFHYILTGTVRLSSNLMLQTNPSIRMLPSRKTVFFQLHCLHPSQSHAGSLATVKREVVSKFSLKIPYPDLRK